MLRENSKTRLLSNVSKLKASLQSSVGEEVWVGFYLLNDKIIQHFVPTPVNEMWPCSPYFDSLSLPSNMHSFEPEATGSS